MYELKAKYFIVHSPIIHSPNGRFAFIIGELLSTITLLSVNRSTGELAVQQTISALPDDFAGDHLSAAIQIAPSGRHLYASIRGPDNVAVFAIDQKTGRLTHLNHHGTGGKTPRFVVTDPSGAFLLAANQDSKNVVVFKINQETGLPEPTGDEIEVPNCVCVRFLAKK